MSACVLASYQRRFTRAAKSLGHCYGEPTRSPLPLGNKRDPLDELVFIVLTVMTEFGVEAVFQKLRARYRPWDRIATARESSIARLLQPVGLSTQRARRLRAMIREVVRREGSADLSQLGHLSDEELEEYLATLPGVGTKVARCVMLYSLGREVFPVDAHVLRVLKRLGLASPDLTMQKAQDTLQPQVPSRLRYALHVNLVQHGRTVCKARRPICAGCCLRRLCPSRAHLS